MVLDEARRWRLWGGSDCCCSALAFCCCSSSAWRCLAAARFLALADFFVLAPPPPLIRRPLPEDSVPGSVTALGLLGEELRLPSEKPHPPIIVSI